MPTFFQWKVHPSKVPYPHIHRSPLMGEENQTLECNTTCHAKSDVVCIYEYGMFESVFDNLQPLCLLLTNWDEQFVHNYWLGLFLVPKKVLREKCKKGGGSSSANFKLICAISSWIMEPLSTGPPIKIWPIQLIPL